MDFKPASWHELNRINDEKLLQMSKNDAVISLIQQRQGRGVQYHLEMGKVNAGTPNDWNIYADLNGGVPLPLGVGRVIQVRVYIPHTYISSVGGTAYSALRVWNGSMRRAVTYFTRRYDPTFNPASSFAMAGTSEDFPPSDHDMDQSVFMMGVFATGDIPDHRLIVHAKPFFGTLVLDSGGYITVEDMGGMAAFPQ